MTYQVITDIKVKLTAAFPAATVIDNPVDAGVLTDQLIAITLVTATYGKVTGGYSPAKLGVAIHIISVGTDVQSESHDLTDSVAKAIMKYVEPKTDANVAFSFNDEGEQPYQEAIITFIANQC